MTDLLLALGIGLLIGAERGWEERGAPEGSRVAGIRTFGLLGLLGAVAALLAREFGPLVLGFGFIATALPLALAYYIEATAEADRSATTLVAALVTFGLGALATLGLRIEAVASAVVVALLLSLKPQIHGFLRKIAPAELYAALQLLVLFAVVLPFLPDRDVGPWQLINPRDVGWMIALIAAVSFAGYVAVRLSDARRGLLLTGLLGGLVSSTAVVLQFSRMMRERSRPTGALAAGMLAACTMMWLRMLTLSAILSPPLAQRFAVPLLAMALVVLAWALAADHASDTAPAADGLALANPLSLVPALQFGGLLVVIVVFAGAARHFLGDAGTFAAAATAGIADVDAITLTLARQAGSSIPVELAAQALLVASTVNTLVKAAMAFGIAGGEGLRRVALPLVSGVAAGGLVAALT